MRSPLCDLFEIDVPIFAFTHCRDVVVEVSKAGGSLWCPHFSELQAGDLARARELGLIVAVWTVNEPHDIDAMIDLRVDAIVTDYPGRLQRRLSDRGFRWAG